MQRNSLLLPRRHSEFLPAGDWPGQAERPLTIARHGFAGVIDDDELFLDGLARQEVVVLAREGPRFAADIAQQRLVVADKGLRCDRGNPVRVLESQVHPFVSAFDVVGAESRFL
jgi:hypothetical protein